MDTKPPSENTNFTDDELAEICYKEIQEVLRKHNCKMIVQFTHKDNENSLDWDLFIEKLKD